MKTMRGFTLIELMVTIAILGVILGIAIPSFREMTANNRQMTTTNLFISAFNQARNEAITRSTDVTISANAGGWKNGWTITAGTIAIASQEALPSQVIVTADSNTYSYNRQGRLNILGDETITVCDDRIGENGRQITLAPIGRASTTSIVCP